MQPYESKYIDAGGVRTHYIEAGQGDPIVLIHGGGAGADSWGNWSKTMPLLAERRHVVAFDMLGFGRTAKPDGGFEYTQEARNTHLAHVLEALNIKDATLVGNSMGGATAISAAVRHPDRVKSLVLMGSAGLVTHLTEAIQTVLKFDFTRDGMVRIVRALTTDGYKIDDELIDYRMHLAMDPDAQRAFSASMKWVHQQGGLYYDESFVRSIGVPTLVVNGKEDKVVSLDVARAYLDTIPRSWGYFIPQCGHWAMLEHPADFASAVLNFVEHTA